MTTTLKDAYAPAPPSTKRSSNTTIIFVAIALGLVTVVLNMLYISMIRRENEAKVITIYKLAREVPLGYRINTERDLIATRLPENLRDSLPVQPVPERSLQAVTRDPIKRPARQGELVTYDLWVVNVESVDAKIEPGKRGVPLPINARTAPGLLRPGMRIDIVATFIDPANKVPQTLVVLEHVRVVAVGALTDERSEARAAAFSTITIELEPLDAELMTTIAKHVARDGFDVFVRNRQDGEVRHERINPAVRKLIGLEN